MRPSHIVILTGAGVSAESGLGTSENTHDFGERLPGPASETVPVWVAGLLGSAGD